MNVCRENVKRFSDGVPLMELIQRACLGAKMVDEVYVYCSIDGVKPYIIDGVRFLKRDKSLDGDGVNCNDIVREFMKEVDAVASGKYDSAFFIKNSKIF